MNESKTKQNNWSKIVQTIEKSNLDKQEKIRWKNKNRQLLYRNQLDQQCNQHYTKQQQIRKSKQKQKLEISLQVEKQKWDKVVEKTKKIKTEQKYRVENLKLAEMWGKRKKRNSQASDFGQKSNPFIKLIQKQDQRMLQTKNRFKIQNTMNEVQRQIHKQQKQLKIQQNRMARKQYQKYIEKMNKNIQSNRQKFIHKHLNIQQSQAQGYKRDNNKDNNTQQKQYLNFLNYQASHNGHKNSYYDILDSKVEKINLHVDVPNSSPAYLGRNVCAGDREKQLSMIDATFNQNKYRDHAQKSNRSNSVNLEKKLYSQRKQQSPDFHYQQREMKSLRHQLLKQKQRIKNKRDEKVSLPEIKKQQRMRYNNNLSLDNAGLHFETEPNVEKIRKVEEVMVLGEKSSGKKAYQQYDLISGRQKTIFI